VSTLDQLQERLEEKLIQAIVTTLSEVIVTQGLGDPARAYETGKLYQREIVFQVVFFTRVQ